MPYKDPEKRRETQREYQRKHYESHSQYYKDKSTEKKQQIRGLVRAYKEQPCTDCKVRYPYYVMQLDHVRGIKLYTPAYLYQTGSIRKTTEELAKCEPVCANCHAERTHRRRTAE